MGTDIGCIKNVWNTTDSNGDSQQPVDSIIWQQFLPQLRIVFICGYYILYGVMKWVDFNRIFTIT